MKQIFSIAVFAVLVSCGSESSQVSNKPVANDNLNALLESVKIGTRTAQFYVDLGADSAIIGFAIKGDLGQQQYCPMYASTYRGLPSVTLDVYVSEKQDQMWVQSSWSGYEVLAYHHIGTNSCITKYGEILLLDKLAPQMLGGTAMRFPEMGAVKVAKMATIKYDGKIQ